MSKLVQRVKQAAGAVGTVTTAYKLAITVEGKPIRARTEPAAVRIFGLAIFERDSSLDRHWFGVWNRGKSKAARKALAQREGGSPVE